MLITNQKTLKDSINIYLGLHEIEQKINRSDSTFKDSQYAISSLFQSYQDIITFEETILKVIGAYDQPGFMVTCLEPRDIAAFESDKCPDIKYYQLQGRSYLTFGKSNIETADQLMNILLNTGKVPAYNKAISDMLNLHLMSDDPSYATTHQHQLMEKVTDQIDSLIQLQKMPQYLKDLLIEGIPYRNKQFLQKEEYIKSIFEN